VGRTDAIALPRLMRLLFDFLTTEAGRDPAGVAEVMARDFRRGGRRDLPPFLVALQPDEVVAMSSRRSPAAALPRRQARHLAGGT
jgi:hypothetical protein